MKAYHFFNTGSEAVASRTIVEVTGNALAVDASTEVTSGSRDNAVMTGSSGTLFYVIINLDNASELSIVFIELYFIEKLKSNSIVAHFSDGLLYTLFRSKNTNKIHDQSQMTVFCGTF